MATMATESQSLPAAAIFIDIENVIGHCSALRMQISIKAICDKIEEFSSIRFRQALGDIKKACASTNAVYQPDVLRRELADNFFDIKDIPYRTLNKNSADMCIVTNALSIAYEKQMFTHFIFVSNDQDFIPLYHKLRELPKIVTVICLDSKQVSPLIKLAVDNFIPYETLLPSAAEKIPSAPGAQAAPKLEDAAVEEPKSTWLKRLYTAGRELVAARGEGKKTSDEPPATAQKSAATEDDLCREYTTVLERYLRMPFPSLEMRNRILDQLHVTLAQPVAQPAALAGVSERVFAALDMNRSGDISLFAVTATVTSLFYSQSFFLEYKNGADKLDRPITGIRYPQEKLLEMLSVSYVRALFKSMKPGETNQDVLAKSVEPEALAKILYEHADKSTVARCRAHIEEAIRLGAPWAAH